MDSSSHRVRGGLLAGYEVTQSQLRLFHDVPGATAGLRVGASSNRGQ